MGPWGKRGQKLFQVMDDLIMFTSTLGTDKGDVLTKAECVRLKMKFISHCKTIHPLQMGSLSSLCHRHTY
jgi:hypothetical protein